MYRFTVAQSPLISQQRTRRPDSRHGSRALHHDICATARVRQYPIDKRGIVRGKRRARTPRHRAFQPLRREIGDGDARASGA